VVHDEITDSDWNWTAHNYVRLDPYHEPAHVLSVRRLR
jgi:starch synthase (maltosyl-transferring)